MQKLPNREFRVFMGIGIRFQQKVSKNRFLGHCQPIPDMTGFFGCFPGKVGYDGVFRVVEFDVKKVFFFDMVSFSI